MKLCLEEPTEKKPVELIAGHIYKYKGEDWYYIYGKHQEPAGYFTDLYSGSMWRELNNESSIKELTDVTDQFCMKRI